MKRMIFSVLAVFATVAGFWPTPLAAQPVRDGKIRILGSATVETVADHVVVRVGVSNRAASPAAALDQNSGIARKLIDFSKQFGVEQRDIQTDAINLAPATKSVRDPNGTVRQEPDGYVASNMVRVKLNDISRLGTFMRQVLDQGATNINGVQFGVSQPEKFADEARIKAVEDATHQARLLAEAAKVRLGAIHEIVHPPRSEFRRTDAAAQMPFRSKSAVAVPIEVGTIPISAEVEITWLIE
jgi:uncharacterized protein YggE